MSRQFFDLLVSTLFCSLLLAAPSDCKNVVRDKDPVIRKCQTPVYIWSEHNTKPRAMVLAIHGLALHGTIFDTTARHLANQNILVAAPDLRGHGGWINRQPHAKAQYTASEQDLVTIAKALREAHPGVPLFVLGESLGGTAAIRLAGKHPDLVDGLVLSAPALRYYRHVVDRHTVMQLAQLAAHPARGISVANYIHYFSNDEKIRAEQIADPLLRKRMGVGELLSSCRFMSNAAACVDDIPSDMPVLVMQGRHDQMVKQSSVDLLDRKLKSKDKRVCWFPQAGHILLETKHVRPEALNTVSGWLHENSVDARTTHATATASDLPGAALPTPDRTGDSAPGS